MSLHNEKPSTERLDTLARVVLAKAIEYERVQAEVSRSNYGAANDGALCQAVKEYREAMVAELIGPEASTAT